MFKKQAIVANTAVIRTAPKCAPAATPAAFDHRALAEAFGKLDEARILAGDIVEALAKTGILNLPQLNRDRLEAFGQAVDLVAGLIGK